ncbi:hypothetical protein CRG98_025230 [Punica granatum]|uniref:Uncharacterized protein n=1 Tax=Punica granatum TaxID=22663 RepID=A0A2I0JEL4_PUNGR|nr:hypothetical protein CRG98_025230 [Punica granatum]
MGYKEHKYYQLYVKHIADPKAYVENPKAATEGSALETSKGIVSGSLGRKRVKAVVDPTVEETEDNSSGSKSDFGYGNVAADLSEEDDPKLQDIISLVEIAKKNRAEKLKSVRLEKDLETIVREAKQDKQKIKEKEKEGAIVTADATYEGYITDYLSSNETCSIISG